MNDADGILGFLSRAWSENADLVLRRFGRFGSDPQRSAIYVPDFHDETVHPDLTDLPRWRWWRFATFHESMHDLYSPKSKEEYARGLVRRLGDSKPELFPQTQYPGSIISMTSETALMLHIINIIEDYRIEKLGLRTYVGYEGESEWRKGVAREWWTNNPAMPSGVHEEVLNEFRNATLMDVPPVAHQRLVSKWDALARTVETVGELSFASLVVLEDILREFGPLPTTFTMLMPQDFIICDGDASSLPDGDKVPEAILRELATVMDEAQRIDVENEFASEILVDKQEVLDESSMVPVMSWTITRSFEDLMSGSDSLTQRLMTLLRRWQVGWKEVLRERGDDIDPEEYVLSRFSDDPSKKFFIDEQLLTPKTNLAVLLDLSGSIGHANLQDPYLRAAGVICGALDFVGTKFALFGFRGGPDHFYVIKTLRQSWDSRRRNMLASLHADGGTPLAGALRWVRHFSGFDDYKRVVVITDGKPDNTRHSVDAARALVGSGVKLSMLGFTKKVDRGKLFPIVGRYGGVEVIDDIADLPVAFFELVRA